MSFNCESMPNTFLEFHNDKYHAFHDFTNEQKTNNIN